MQQPISASHNEITPALERSGAPDMVPVWDWPLRAWHWSLAFFVLLAWFMPDGPDGVHRFAGYAVVVLLAFRIGWGLFGTRYSRFRALGRRLRAAPGYLVGLRHGKAGRYRGLNPAGTATLVAMLLLLAASTVTGLMSTTVRFFGVAWVEDIHIYASYAVIALVVIHVLGVLAMSVLQKENLVRAMLTGFKRRRR